jgi:hypothetical protein
MRVWRKGLRTIFSPDIAPSISLTAMVWGDVGWLRGERQGLRSG